MNNLMSRLKSPPRAGRIAVFELPGPEGRIGTVAAETRRRTVHALRTASPTALRTAIRKATSRARATRRRRADPARGRARFRGGLASRTDWNRQKRRKQGHTRGRATRGHGQDQRADRKALAEPDRRNDGRSGLRQAGPAHALFPPGLTHTDSGGEIHRDEIPLAYQRYVQHYFEQVRKTPAPASPTKARVGR